MRVCVALGAAMFLIASAACAADVTSGIAAGGSVPAYGATKCGGVDDGVAVGKSLCYT